MIRELVKNDVKHASFLMHEAFPWAYSVKEAKKEVTEMLKTKTYVTLVKVDGDEVVGLIGAKPMYGHTGWELHPLCVKQSKRGKHYGKSLVIALEDNLKQRGATVIYLGTDDEHFQTSLSQSDLFIETFRKIETIENLKRHPYSFYERLGYKIVGVIPDANGNNKPDIMMAKRM